MRIVFMGSADFACPSLSRLAVSERTVISAVVTQPDRPCGRGLEISAAPLKKTATALGLRTITPEDVNSEDSIAELSAMKPDLIVVVAYGQILRKALLSIPARGCVNIHGSLLPRYRGAAPIQWAIARGETRTGVTSMFVSERMDAGDMIFRRETPIEPADTGGTLHDRLSGMGADLLIETINAMETGNAPRIPQVEADATYAPKLTRQHGRLDWRKPAAVLVNEIRAFNPWPASWCQLPHGVMLKVLAGRIEAATGRPGEMLDTSGDGLLVAAGEGAVRLIEVKPEGKKAMTGKAFLLGHQFCRSDLLK